jgi:hypothetical protein
MRRITEIRHSQQGMVSILVTMIMMLVISLIIVGFAQVTRHAQRAALDRQLNSQAYYAAESGVNDAIGYLQGHLASLPAANTDCKSFITTANLDATLDNGVGYSCLMVDPTPPQLTLAPVPAGQTTVWAIKSASGSPWRNLTFKWASNADDAATRNGACPTPAGSFPTVTNWRCNYSLLRVDLVETSTLNAATVNDSSRVGTIFISPLTSGGSASVAYAAGGPKIVGARCSAGTCTMQITGLSSASYYMRLTLLYERSDSVILTGVTNDGEAGHFSDSQAVIDATGKAQDELRRLKVVVPLTGAANGVPLPLNGLQTTGDICKYYTIIPNQSANPANLCG